MRGRLSWLVIVLIMSAGSLATHESSPARAATPASGKVGAPPDSPIVSWQGDFRDAAVSPRGCDVPGSYCDVFTVNVDVAPTYWVEHAGGLQVEISWESPNNVFMAGIYDAEGDLVTGGNTDEQLASGNTSRTLFAPNASGIYTVLVVYSEVVMSDYGGVARFLSGEPGEARVLFDELSPLVFAPATIASAHFLGTEPMTVMERSLPGSTPGAVDPDRIFIDWPLTSSTEMGQVVRSEDGGDSFRLLFDPVCASRSRPTCASGGGGDTDTDVNPYNGNVYFTDLEVPANVSVASSTDHGDTWPIERQFAVSNPTFVTDRQWITWAKPGLAEADGRPVEAFFSYYIPATGVYIQGLDDDGRPIPQPAPQLSSAEHRFLGGTGPLRVDSTAGPGHGWLYQPVIDSRPAVATAPVDRYQEEAAWKIQVIADNNMVVIFPWLTLDDSGNAYMTWVTPGTEAFAGQPGPWVVRFSASPIDHALNDPSKGGRPGTFWTRPARASLPNIGSVLFPEVTAIDRGRIAIAYYGTDDFEGRPDDAPRAAEWNAYATVISNAFSEGGPPIASTGVVGHRVAHKGPICTGGAIGCSDAGADRSLADMIDVGVDEKGRVGVVFTDNNSGFARVAEDFTAHPFPHFAKQTGGPSLLIGEPPIDIDIPTDSRDDASDDATWPNQASAPNLPSADLTRASIAFDGTHLNARIPLVEGSIEAMLRDLQTYRSSYPSPVDQESAQRLQYVMRFSTSEDIFHLSMDVDDEGVPRFFGGKLDENDRLRTAPNETTVDVYGASYKADANFPVTGEIEGNTIVLRARADRFGLKEGSQLFSATAFAMAGPSEQGEESVFNVMRTIDASPPFDAVLDAPEPQPPPSPTSSSPTPTTGDVQEPVKLVLTPQEQKVPRSEVGAITATVIDAQGDPVPGADIDWRSEGQGALVASESRADEDGTARATITSEGPGSHTVFASTDRCSASGDCDDTAVTYWGPNYCDIFGTRTNDTIVGTAASETICGFGGQDKIDGGDGDDVIYGSSGFDDLTGGIGDDVLYGGRGLDRLFGGPGRDLIHGRQDDDQLHGEQGHDRLIGGRRHDEMRGGPGRDFLDGRIGTDTCDGGLGRDRKVHCEF